MKPLLLSLTLAAALIVAGCRNAGNAKSQKTEDMENEPLKEVAGRKNFGPNHALVTTPQPCVMIATWTPITIPTL